MTRFKSVGVNIGIIFLAIFILGIILEIGLAVVQINQKSHVRLVPGKGVTYIPGAYYRHTKEGFSQGYFNSHGFRDYERTYEKPKDTFRILIFGDSYVEALQVSLEDSFPALLEKKLNAGSSTKKVEVIALGQSGFGTADAYMRYVNFGVKYSPDLVILAFLTGNDFRDNSKVLSREALAYYYVFDDNGQLVLDSSKYEEYERGMISQVRGLFQSLKRKSYLLSLVSERVYLLMRKFEETRFEHKLAGMPQVNENREIDPFSDLNIYRTDVSVPWKDAFEISKRLILKFKDTVEENGAKFVLVTLSNAEQVHPRIGEKLNARYPVVFDYERPDRMLEEFAKQKGIIALKLMPEFRAYHLQTGKDLHGFGSSGVGHWNEDGHRLAAEEILKFLQQQNLVPSGEKSSFSRT